MRHASVRDVTRVARAEISLPGRTRYYRDTTRDRDYAIRVGPSFKTISPKSRSAEDRRAAVGRRARLLVKHDTSRELSAGFIRGNFRYSHVTPVPLFLLGTPRPRRALDAILPAARRVARITRAERRAHRPRRAIRAVALDRSAARLEF